MLTITLLKPFLVDSRMVGASDNIRPMEWTSLLLGLGVPILSFTTGMIANKVSQRDVRTRLKQDIELMESLPRDSEGYTLFLENVNARVRDLTEKSTPTTGVWSAMVPRRMRPLFSMGIQYVFAGVLLYALSIWVGSFDESTPDYSVSDSTISIASTGLLILGVLVFVMGVGSLIHLLTIEFVASVRDTLRARRTRRR